MASAQYPAEMFVRFVETFTPEQRPDVVSMSGGEALLRPALVRRLAETCRAVGTRSAVLSGMFFATGTTVPGPIRAALAAVDHFSASIDAFHEAQVPRARVFRVLEDVLTAGVDVSVHIVGRDSDDPYVEGLVADVHERFGGCVPMLVNSLAAFGRAADWLAPSAEPTRVPADASPCAMAAWPVVGFDGTIVACGNDAAYLQSVPHLRLGHASTDDWATIRARCVESPMLRAIRMFGPRYLAQHHGAGEGACDGYCQSCLRFSARPELESSVRGLMTKPSTAIMESEVALLQQQGGALLFARRHGIPRYADLVTRGASA
jgi:pyruvate-formate lyase-activating enzyme